MDFEDGLLQQATELWDHGEFITTNIDGEARSLYRYKGNLYVIWYTPSNVLEKIAVVDSDTAKKLFNKFRG
jgi:hypothetical protein